MYSTVGDVCAASVVLSKALPPEATTKLPPDIVPFILSSFPLTSLSNVSTISVSVGSPATEAGVMVSLSPVPKLLVVLEYKLFVFLK